MPTAPSIHLDILQNVSIASPCEARWDDMAGDDKVRHCSLCALNVHNLSAMTREEAEEFVASARRGDGSGRTCVRFFRRTDGTILTRDCPRGLAAARARLARTAGRIAAFLGLAGLTAAAAHATGPRGRAGAQAPARNSFAVRWITSVLNPAPFYPVMGDMCVGKMAAPAPPPGPAATPQTTTGPNP